MGEETRVTKRRVLLVDDEITVLLTLKAVLEISGFDVETAASAKEGKSKIGKKEYDMIITDMRMENDVAGVEVIRAARNASYHPAVALLTAFPMSDEDWATTGADKMLIKPMQTRLLLQQIEKLLTSHQAKLAKAAAEGATKAKLVSAPAGTSNGGVATATKTTKAKSKR